MLLVVIFTALILILGIREIYIHKKRINKIPIRININGIRGKSTITRLIYGILREDNYKVIGKTTGTDARMLYWFDEEEYPVVRKPQGPNIGEQKDILQNVNDNGGEAIVNECMAVNPDYQIIFQNQLLKANIGVIVNVMEDHMETLGPTLDEVAEAFTATIPYNGKLIVMKDDYTDFFKKEADKRNTETIVVDRDEVEESLLREFDYIVFPDNVAIAMGVAEAVGANTDTALKGMLNAPPDSGAVHIHYYHKNDTKNIFVNAFAANEPQSTKAILQKVIDYKYPFEKKVIILNCRGDRLDRTKLFAENFITEVDYDTLICVGKSTQLVTEVMKSQPDKKYLNFEGKPFEEVEKAIYAESENALVFCVGNIHGNGKKVVNLLEGLD
ncbi:poly-gamma-glutamate synthesis protein PgsB [Staphylococcus piscifermentans]|uniref:Poly-gamma-glutamate synthase PgsB n=1 Tax=Staphylococcus piscifermentans TaxID=70258 RepID=A0A239TJY0_9STAP|nr:poly-gamma-glutamate synthase PgsB [Staphylococcus piscifermentans]RTX85344.1 poly-gamma-glutamate synthase PgsB [Staphylococcus piscifermentans]GEP85341.1 poly-gamma-glutamate synthase PgsB [Staphylococcus piscifermentans]SNU96953.1 poly-gamma-glutamate synthesis protein PgsB [Staphylococcus piscifermentans]